jgi:hypothetical protein
MKNLSSHDFVCRKKYNGNAFDCKRPHFLEILVLRAPNLRNLIVSDLRFGKGFKKTGLYFARPLFLEILV